MAPRIPSSPEPQDQDVLPPIEDGLPLPLRLPVYDGVHGLCAGLDGLSNKALLDAADS